MIRDLILGVQMLFVAFGALTLVPLLTGLDPSVALFTAGMGTLVFYFITKRRVPVFLASSFAFIAPIVAARDQWGIPVALGGLFAAGFVHMAMAGVIRWRGVGFVDRFLPAVVVGPIGGYRLVHGRSSTQYSPSVATSFFQIGTVRLSVSMA